MAFIKPIKERGIVISKTYREAREEREDFQGKKWPAKPEEYVVEVISCDGVDFNENMGILNGTRCEYKVDKVTFDKVKFGTWVNVKYVASQYGDKINIKGESLTL